MNQIFNKFLLEGDQFMPEMHLRQRRFTFSACGPFTKNKQRIKKFMQMQDTNYIYKNELHKVYFQHDMAYGKCNDLERRIQSDKVLKDKAFQIAKNPKYDGYQRGLPSMVCKFFDKKSKETGIKSISNQQLANEIHKPIIISLFLFKKKSVSFFKDNIWGC